MKFIKQTRVHIADKQYGNCFPTVIACLLDLEIADVPNFELLYNVKDTFKGDTELWQRILISWLHSKGYEWYTVKQEDILPDEYYLVVGLSPRGIMHVCIYQNGKMVWDPHPSDGGLTDERYIEIIRKRKS